jgi:segregation and condensation protein A
MLKILDIDLAGDFLVMAATLMQIKSAMLLPKAEPDSALLGEDDLADPRTELIRQLLEYKKFKDAANLLNAAADEQKERFGRPATIVEQLKPIAEPEIDIEQVSIWNLLDAFDSICKATGTIGDISRIKDDTPIDSYQIDILHRLQTEGPMTFERLFESRTNRLAMIGLFLALLELIREKLIWAKQQASSSSIYLRPLTDEPAEQAVQKAIIAVEADDKSAHPQASLEAAEQQKQPPLTISEFASKIRSVVLQQKQEQVEEPFQQGEEIQAAEDHKK